jgi:phosphoribosylaminoimidazolecarboxamide formyltransferase / IMP cyclohydrolase
MIRSAAKNHRFVLVVTSPDRYEKVLGDLRQHAGSSCGKHRLKQAQRAFAHTAEYDGHIAAYLAKQIAEPASAESAKNRSWPKSLDFISRAANPCATAKIRIKKARSTSIATHRGVGRVRHSPPRQGTLVHQSARCRRRTGRREANLTLPAACIVKHATPCGCAVAPISPPHSAAPTKAIPLPHSAESPRSINPSICPPRRPSPQIDKLLEVIVAPSYSRRRAGRSAAAAGKTCASWKSAPRPARSLRTSHAQNRRRIFRPGARPGRG